MVSYFNYLQEMFKAVMQDLGKFFLKVFISPWADVGENFKYYNSVMERHVDGFGFLGWFFWVLFLLLLIGF